METFNIKFAVAGLMGLVIGLFIYMIGRQNNSIYILNILQLNYKFQGGKVFSCLSNNVPDLLHAFSFSILSSSFFSKKSIIFYFNLCAIWFIIDCLFEIMQFFKLNLLLIINKNFSINIISKSINSFAMNGSFDILDIVSYFTGCFFAFILIILNLKR